VSRVFSDRVSTQNLLKNFLFSFAFICLFLFFDFLFTLCSSFIFLKAVLPKHLTNVAGHRPAYQSSDQNHWTTGPGRAVDTKKEVCSETQWGTDQWWRVDLGKEVWVEKVLLSNTKHEMKNIEIRIGKI